MKASDLDDREFLQAVHTLATDGRTPWPTPGPRWVSIWELEPVFPHAPPKVVAAKFRQMVKRKLLTGCTCGCRGDLIVTPAGHALIEGA